MRESLTKYLVCSLYTDEHLNLGPSYGVLTLTRETIAELRSRFALYRKCLEVHPTLWATSETFGYVRFYDMSDMTPPCRKSVDPRHLPRLLFLEGNSDDSEAPFSEEQASEYQGLLDRLEDLDEWRLFDVDPFEGAVEINIDSYEMITAAPNEPRIGWRAGVKHTDFEVSTPNITESDLYNWEEALD